MTDVKLCPPSQELIAKLAPNVELADLLELSALHPGKPVDEILSDSVAASFICLIAVINGEPSAIFGCAIGENTEGSVGVPWAIFTENCRTYPKVIMQVALTYMRQWDEWFPVLANVVDKRNTRAIRWLKRLGFTMAETITTPEGIPFFAFERFNV